MALFGAGASAGFASAYSAWLSPALAAALLVTIGALAYGGAGAGTVGLSLLGSVALLAGRLQPRPGLLLYLGVTTLVLAAVLGTRRRPRRSACEDCSHHDSPTA